MICPRCRHENAAAARFCVECGQKLAPGCPQCGAEVPAAARFCAQCGAPLAPAAPPEKNFASPSAYTPAHLAEKILKARGALQGERKQVTVLFADVSGFTAISEKLDPEEVHRLMNGAFELMLGAIHRFEGTANQFLGDGLMALFGAPIAHEDHAQRAVHAALEIQRALHDYREGLKQEHGVDFRMRIGLNTGLVVVGAIGDNLRMDYTAVGDTTNLAARMQQLAQPGQIIVAEPTQRLVHGYFETRPLGSVTVKNRQEPVDAWEVVRAKGMLTRLEVQAEQGLTPFVGREQELAALERAFGLAKDGHGQIVFVVGEPGMGKSRLLLEFKRRLQGEKITWVEGPCISFGGSIPFLPIIEMLKRNFRIVDGASEAEIVAKVDRGLTFLGGDAPTVGPYLKYLLSVNPGDPAVAAMDPAQRRPRIFEALRQIALRGSQLRPIVMVIEDLHWIDPASEEYLKFLADSLAGAAVLLILTYRPGYSQPFGDRTFHSRIALQPLSEDESARMARGLLEASDLPHEVRAIVSRKAEGNPFFLEEIVRSLVETGALRRDNGRYVLARSAGDIHVPDTIQDVIMARIDRLAEEQKRTIQVASVVGREFALRLLKRISDIREQVERCLSELKSLEFIYEKTLFPDPEYIFKHALTHDVAYSSILVSQRKELHALIGRAIEEVYADRIEERLEELAYHFGQGEAWDKAFHYLRQAGTKAVALCVDREAVGFYERALEALDHLPEGPERDRQAIDLRLQMRAPLWRLGNLDRLFELFREAETLARRLGSPKDLNNIYSFLMQYHWAMGEQERTMEYGERCLRAADESGDLGLRLIGNYYLGHCYYSLGQMARAVEYYARDVEVLEGAPTTEQPGMSGLPYIVSCAWVAGALAGLGEFERAQEFSERGFRVAQAANHPYSLALLQTGAGLMYVIRGDLEKAIAILEAALQVCREKHFAGWIMLSASALADAYVLSGRPVEAIALYEEAIRTKEATITRVNFGVHWAGLGEALLLAGRLDEARRAAEQALRYSQAQREEANEARAQWLLAEIAARQSPPAREEAEARLGEAIRLAEALGLRPFLGRCWMSLGLLARKAGDEATARKWLEKAAALFRSLGMTWWEAEARRPLAP
ncbi:MAG: AAA family ATPase [Candidatus Rokubacteria bacterium]|nr:AAA family ATPase [Candidatus Rokubacteria bacterium]